MDAGIRHRFLCDEMLGRLGRYLRAAGFDTALATPGDSDAGLLRRSHAEARRFLTCDRRIEEHKAARDVLVLLPQGDLEDHARALSARLDLDWLAGAFTRCTVDNGMLEAAEPGARSRLPPGAMRADEAVLTCPLCRRLYWRGSHWRRMHERLARWQRYRPPK